MMQQALIIMVLVGSLYNLWCLYLVYRRSYKALPAVSGKKVSIIIPFYNDAENILEALTSLDQQVSTNDIELILVNDCSTDKSDEIVERWVSNSRLNIKYLKMEKNSGKKAPPLVFGYRHIRSDTDAIVVMDGDTTLNSDSIQLLVDRLYSKPNLAGVSGAIYIRESKATNWLERIQVWEHFGAYPFVKSALGEVSRVPIMSGALSIHRKEAVDQVGVWGEDWLVEDISWTYRALLNSWGVEYEPKAIGFTEAPSTLRKLGNQRRRWARGRVEAFKVSAKEFPAKTAFWFSVWLMTYLSIPIAIACWFYQPWLAAASAFLGLLIAPVGSQLVNKHTFGSDVRLDNIKISLSCIFMDVVLSPYRILGTIEELLGFKKSWLTR